MNCIFCKIGEKSIPSHIVYEDKNLIAFLDLSPIRPGHTQIIPKEHHDYFDHLPAHIAAEIMNLGQKLATKMKQTFKVERVAFAFTGGDVQHAHAHIIPLHEKDDLTSRRYITNSNIEYSTDHLRVTPAELQKIQKQLVMEP